MAHTPLFQTENLEFGGFIKYPDLTIFSSCTTFLMGESGVGKSTLLRLFNATVSPSAGIVRYRGEDIQNWDTLMLRHEVCLISQNVFLFDADIRTNFRRFSESREQAALDDARIRYYLQLCMLDLPLEQNCATLSGGQRQRVYMALFLSFQPRVILLDEPTSALDASNGRAVLKNLLGYCGERGIDCIVVSHDRELAEEFAAETIVLS